MKSRTQLYKYGTEESRQESRSAQRDQITLAYKPNVSQHHYAVVEKADALAGCVMKRMLCKM